MKFGHFIITFSCLYISQLTFSAINEPAILNLLEEVQQKTKDAGSLNNLCPSCEDNIAENLSSNKICKDLFTASCLKSNGEKKYIENNNSWNEQKNEILYQTRDEVAKKLGFKNFDEQMKKVLLDHEIELAYPLNQTKWNDLVHKEFQGKSNVEDSDKKLFKLSRDCDDEQENLKNSITANKLKDNPNILDKPEALIAKYNEYLIKFYAKNIPSYMENFQITCEMLRPEYTKFNYEIETACKNFTSIKKEAINLFRIEGKSTYIKDSEAFVRKTMLPQFKFSEYIKNEDVLSMAREKQNTLNTICSNLDRAIRNVAQVHYNSVMLNSNLSQYTIETFMNSYLGKNQVSSLRAMFTEIIANINNITSEFVTDPQKKVSILTGYKNLRLSFLAKPTALEYKTNKDGLIVLNEKNEESEVYAIFSDPELSYFSILNAYFSPQITIGRKKISESITILPTFVKGINTNEMSVFGVLAHEVGHKIDPNISKNYHYDLSTEYKDLLACYKDPDSIKMQKGQEGEVIADYISSEVIARKLMKIPINQRNEALISSIKHFCQFENSSSFNCYAEHPENIIRVNGIYAANPNLRKILGCKKEDSSEFKSCGLKALKSTTQAKK